MPLSDVLFTDSAALRNAGVQPSICAFGDSWFWYFSFGGNLLNTLAPLVNIKGNTIYAVGNVGAELNDFSSGKYRRAFEEAIRLYGKDLSAVFFSLVGNDFAGVDDLSEILNPDCSGANTVKDCLKQGAGGYKAFIQTASDQYQELIGYLYTRTHKNCRVILHTYDYAIPNGVGFGGPSSPSVGWLKAALVKCKVPKPLHQPVISQLIDDLYKMLAKIKAADPDFIHIVDSRGILKENEWANELHPTGTGFAKIANTSWAPVLRSLNLAA
jgi:hypothetical protein